jgi:Na+-transporting malonate decarboxylase carboxybiotin decarboxylase subunit
MELLSTLQQMFPGIGTMFDQSTAVVIARIVLIIVGFILALYGYKRTLEPLIMIPMGIGMMAVNAGMLYLDTGIGTLFLDSLISDPDELINILQIDWLQPIYTFTFSNGLIACLVFMGIGARAEISFLLARPWASVFIAICGEFGTFVTLVLGYSVFGLDAGQAAAVATIGGADGPMVLFTSLMLAKEYFVPISIIAYLYLSLCYGGYPYIIKMMVPKKYRGIDMFTEIPEVSQQSKFVFIVVVCGVLCLLLPVASPLIVSFFVGMAIKEAQVEPYQDFMETVITYGSTFFLALLLGCLCDAATLLDPTVGVILILGILALFFSAIGGLIGGWIMYFVSKKQFNPVVGIAGVSCMPTTSKLAQHAASEEDPFAMVLGVAMGANVCGVITSAIVAGVFVATIGMVV